MLRRVLAISLCLASVPALADPQSAMALINSIPGVLKAQEDPGGNLWVVVQNKNPQTQWNNVATNICKAVIPHHARIFLVKIVDAATIAPKSKPKDWALLGAANCGNVQ